MSERAADYAIKAMWTIWVLYWVVMALNTKRTRRPAALAQRAMRRGIFLCLLLAAWWWGHHDGALRRWLPDDALVRTLGVTLCAAGIWFSIWARSVLGRNWSGLVVVKEDHELIQSGPYGLVRHPIYTGLIIALAGTVAVVAPTVGGAVFLAVVYASLIFKLRWEEKIMMEEFPEAYPAYKARVRSAVLPGIY